MWRGQKSDLERGNRWKDWIWEEAGWKGIFLHMCGENGSLLYSSQREYGTGCGLVSSARRGAFLSWLPRGGAPAAASDTGPEERLTGGAKDASRKWTNIWNPQEQRSDKPKRQYLSLCFPCGGEKRTTLAPILWWSQKLVVNRSYDWNRQATAGNYQNKQREVYTPASLPTETIFSIHVVGLTQHHVHLKFIKHSVIPANLRETLIIWDIKTPQTCTPCRFRKLNKLAVL